MPVAHTPQPSLGYVVAHLYQCGHGSSAEFEEKGPSPDARLEDLRGSVMVPCASGTTVADLAQALEWRLTLFCVLHAPAQVSAEVKMRGWRGTTNSFPEHSQHTANQSTRAAETHSSCYICPSCATCEEGIISHSQTVSVAPAPPPSSSSVRVRLRHLALLREIDTRGTSHGEYDPVPAVEMHSTLVPLGTHVRCHFSVDLTNPAPPEHPRGQVRGTAHALHAEALSSERVDDIPASLRLPSRLTLLLGDAVLRVGSGIDGTSTLMDALVGRLWTLTPSPSHQRAVLAPTLHLYDPATGASVLPCERVAVVAALVSVLRVSGATPSLAAKPTTSPSTTLAEGHGKSGFSVHGGNTARDMRATQPLHTAPDHGDLDALLHALPSRRNGGVGSVISMVSSNSCSASSGGAVACWALSSPSENPRANGCDQRIFCPSYVEMYLQDDEEEGEGVAVWPLQSGSLSSLSAQDDASDASSVATLVNRSASKLQRLQVGCSGGLTDLRSRGGGSDDTALAFGFDDAESEASGSEENSVGSYGNASSEDDVSDSEESKASALSRASNGGQDTASCGTADAYGSAASAPSTRRKRPRSSSRSMSMFSSLPLLTRVVPESPEEDSNGIHLAQRPETFSQLQTSVVATGMVVPPSSPPFQLSQRACTPTRDGTTADFSGAAVHTPLPSARSCVPFSTPAATIAAAATATPLGGGHRRYPIALSPTGLVEDSVVAPVTRRGGGQGSASRPTQGVASTAFRTPLHHQHQQQQRLRQRWPDTPTNASGALAAQPPHWYATPRDLLSLLTPQPLTPALLQPLHPVVRPASLTREEELPVIMVTQQQLPEYVFAAADDEDGDDADGDEDESGEADDGGLARPSGLGRGRDGRLGT